MIYDHVTALAAYFATYGRPNILVGTEEVTYALNRTQNVLRGFIMRKNDTCPNISPLQEAVNLGRLPSNGQSYVCGYGWWNNALQLWGCIRRSLPIIAPVTCLNLPLVKGADVTVIVYSNGAVTVAGQFLPETNTMEMTNTISKSLTHTPDVPRDDGLRWLYWVQVSGLYAAQFNTSTAVLSGQRQLLGFPSLTVGGGMFVDKVYNKIYWVDDNTMYVGDVNVMNPQNIANIKTLLSQNRSLSGVFVDSARGNIY